MRNKNHQFNPLMNNTKWEELRLGFSNLGTFRPAWRTKDIETGYVSPWDGEWFYHFRQGGYATIEYVEIKVSSEAMREHVRDVLARIHVPGRETDLGFIVYGYRRKHQPVDYIQGSEHGATGDG